MPGGEDSTARRAEAGPERMAREPELRCRYVERALARIPRLLGAMGGLPAVA